MAFVIVVVFINLQLIIDEFLSQDFPNQLNEAFTKMNMFVMQQNVYSSKETLFCLFLNSMAKNVPHSLFFSTVETALSNLTFVCVCP